MNYATVQNCAGASNFQSMSNPGLSCEKTFRAYYDRSADGYVTRYKTMITDRGVMADVTVTPQDDVVADTTKRMQGVILEDHAVFPDLFGANMAGRVNERLKGKPTSRWTRGQSCTYKQSETV